MSTAEFEAKKIKIVSTGLVILTLILISLGGFVRATEAGLSCPDWPLCFGRVVPTKFGDGVLQEVTHRFIASLVSLLTVTFIVVAFRARKVFPRLWHYSWLLAAMLMIQVIFGGLTVLLKLNPFIVTGHLALGTLFLLLVSVVVFERFPTRNYVHEGKLIYINLGKEKIFSWFILSTTLLAFAQILLGGFVGSSGASLVCPNFPNCTVSLLPENFFSPQGIHMLHRYIAFVLLLCSVVALLWAKKAGRIAARRRGHLFGLVLMISLQIGVGITNVLQRIPVSVTVCHLVLAQMIFLALATFLKDLWPTALLFKVRTVSDQLRGKDIEVENFIEQRKTVGES